MKKAFDANVSRSRPRMRLGAVFTEAGPALDVVETAVAHQTLAEEVVAPVVPSLADTVKTKSEKAKEPRGPVQETIARVLEAPDEPVAFTPPVEVAPEPVAVPAPVARVAVAPKVKAFKEPPGQVVEVQTAPVPMPEPLDVEAEAQERRARLKERLSAVRENPRPEPLPETVAEAGVLAVERISALQTEVLKYRTVNLALSQDLEAARRQAERATEEARLRMDEARRLSAEMDGRAKLLAELEKELASLEAERNEALLSLQEARQGLDAMERDKDVLKGEIQKREDALNESLSEEERLAGELESAHENASALRKTADALRGERDTLARQVSDLTKERIELLEARKALEAVHRALSTAAAR
ncbi:MAG: extensin-like protein [Myxococcaceae bacterium]|nr:extensin-like protein [Myxococcaceae bacterium]